MTGKPDKPIFCNVFESDGSPATGIDSDGRRVQLQRWVTPTQILGDSAIGIKYKPVDVPVVRRGSRQIEFSQTRHDRDDD